MNNKPVILAVDDTPDNLTLLAGLLRDTYRVKVATSGEKALAIARSDAPDLILLDVNMPGMDGYEVCLRLKEDEKLRDISVLFISGLDKPEDKVKAFQGGGVDYITKPFNAEEVKARIATHLSLRRLRLDIEAKNRELELKYRQLKELEQLRDNLVHMIVHDLRSPLMAMIIGLGMLDDEETDPDKKETLQAILQSTSQMKGMVNNLLDISKLESGAMQLNPRPCNFDELAAAALTTLRPLLEEKNLRLAWSPCNCTAVADRELIERVLVNILGNAIKFSPAGKSITLEMKGSAQGGVKILVSDEGPGIPEQYQDKIFEKFGQIEARKAQAGHSTGLGLTFCKLVVESHGGSIGVTRGPGSRTVIWFSLPGQACSDKYYEAAKVMLENEKGLN